MRLVSNLIWETLGDNGYTDPAAFFCECAREGCYQAVWLTPVEHAERRSVPGWRAVAPIHQQAAAR